MNGIQDYYGQEYAQLHAQRPMDGYAQDDNMDTVMEGQSQTLEELLDSQAQYRRRQTYHPQYRASGPSDHIRRASMMEFGGSDLADFQFDPNPAPSHMPAHMQQSTVPHQKSLDPRKVRSRDDLSLSTQFAHMNHNGYGSQVSYSPAFLSGSITADHDDFPPGSMDLSMDFQGMQNNAASVSMPNTAMRQPLFTTSPLAQGFSATYGSSNHNPGARMSPNESMHIAKSQTPMTMNQNSMEETAVQAKNGVGPNPLSSTHQAVGTIPATSAMHQPLSRRHSAEEQSSFPNNAMTVEQLQQSNMNTMMQGATSPTFSRFQNVYSASGFDMLGVLMRIATRRNPEINIGPVDLSCAFVVCDIDKPDMPIVYCSDMFERLTGYTRYEILGRNCRFLQAPDGKVQSGVKRKYVDDRSVLQLKNQIAQRAEAQLSLINYRKGGQPFMNLLTMIPIPWDTEEHRFYVGFQVDLVEHPGSVSGKNPDGTYAINYNRSALPAYSLPPPPDPASSLTDIGQTIPRDEVSQVLATLGSGDTDLSKRILDKLLLENSDDVVHVLSLKGLFLYLSPASRRVLEYDASELVGTPLSSVCHPSDIVPVTRELKDSSAGASVSVVYRVRRKKSGYTWFEAHGCLHTEQGKGRKCIILVGRERPVYALDKNDVSADGIVGDSELWSKMSTSGMFLYMSSNSRQMLDRLSEDLVGTSFQSLMRPESKKEFLRVLEAARGGEKVTFKHDLQNRRGQVLQAQTTLYPGDAKKGNKPTFLLGQTRLLKMTRTTLLNQKMSSSSLSPMPEQSQAGSQAAQTTTTGETGATSSMPESGVISGVFTTAGSNGLPLGNQDEALASEDNIFDELKTTRSTSWQFELRQMERQNRLLAEELQGLISRKKKRKRRKGLGQLEKDCANCHTRVTPEWRRGPSGQRDLCNSCGLRWAKQNGRVSPRKYAQSDKSATSPRASSAIATGGGGGGGNGSHGKTTPLLQKDDSETAEQGNLPAKIEEDEEPPHLPTLPT